MVKTDRSVSTKKLNGLEKVYVYWPRKSTEYSDHIDIVSITSSFTFLLHYIITVTIHKFSTINHECSVMKWLLATTLVIKVIWTTNFSGGPLIYSF